jgi:hypothetical protein
VATGARSYLRIYRNDGLVVAIMSPRRGHNPARLAESIADEVLQP